jgi:hypothetical protein
MNLQLSATCLALYSLLQVESKRVYLHCNAIKDVFKFNLINSNKVRVRFHTHMRWNTSPGTGLFDTARG